MQEIRDISDLFSWNRPPPTTTTSTHDVTTVMAVLRTVPLRDTPELLREIQQVFDMATDRDFNMSVEMGGGGLAGEHIPIATLLEPGHANRSGLYDASGQGILERLQELLSRSMPETVLLFVAYILIFLLSLVSNTLVCYVIFRNKRLRTVTNGFIANLAMSDLAITVVTIPVTLLRFVYKDWVLGLGACRFTHFTLMVSICVSTFTMTAIAIDRYLVILYPLRPRLAFKGGLLVVLVTWILAILMSLPFAIFARVDQVDLLLSTTRRCRVRYPEPIDVYERYVTLCTFLVQYVIPMVITGVAYGHIVQRVWSRQVVGQPTEHQQVSHNKTRKRTVKLLIVVVAVFSVCWLPLNLWHLLTDFHPDNETFYYSSSAFLCLHWLAISSCCYNPFIYCWLNESFRKELKMRLRACCSCYGCCCCCGGGRWESESPYVYPGAEMDEAMGTPHGGTGSGYKALGSPWNGVTPKASASVHSHSSSTKTSSRGSKASMLRKQRDAAALVVYGGGGGGRHHHHQHHRTTDGANADSGGDTRRSTLTSNKLKESVEAV